MLLSRADKVTKAQRVYKQSKEGYLWGNKKPLAEMESIINPDVKGVELHSQYETKIELLEKNTLEGIYYLCEQGVKDVGVLNFASYHYAGGGFLGGAMAQEEALCHCSNLYVALEKEAEWYENHKGSVSNNYSMYSNESILTKNVSLLVDVKGQHLAPDSEVNTFDVLTCAAPNKGAAMSKYVAQKVVDRTMYDRIVYILNIFAKYGYKSLVLGAFGCGVFGNDAHYVATVFADLLNDKFKGVFERVVFAVPSGENYQKFTEVF